MSSPSRRWFTGRPYVECLTHRPANPLAGDGEAHRAGLPRYAPPWLRWTRPLPGCDGPGKSGRGHARGLLSAFRQVKRALRGKGPDTRGRSARVREAGLVFCWLRLESRSLIDSITTHVATSGPGAHRRVVRGPPCRPLGPGADMSSQDLARPAVLYRSPMPADPPDTADRRCAHGVGGEGPLRCPHGRNALPSGSVRGHDGGESWESRCRHPRRAEPWLRRTSDDRQAHRGRYGRL